MANRTSFTRERMAAGWRRFARSWDFAGVWIAIATVLICAVAPAGLPQTTQLGSAFNPATTIVALNSGTGNARLLTKRTIRNETADADAAAAAQRLTNFLTPEPVGMPPARVAGETMRPAIVAAVAAPVRSHARPWQTGPPAT